MSSELPNRWTHSKLGDLGKYLNGYAFNAKTWATSGRPIIRIQNLTGSNDNCNYFQGEIADRYVVRRGDLLVSWAATLGAFVWQGEEAVLNQHIFKVESNIDKSFHRYLIDLKLDEMMKRTHGSGMVHITKSNFDNVPVDVPPLAEQQRIVEILEEQFSRLDAALASIRTVREKVAIFPLAVIAGLIGAKSTDAGTQRLLDTFVLQRGFDLPKHSRLKGDVPVVTSSGITTTHSMAKVLAPGVVTGRSGTIGLVQYVETDFWPLNTTLYVKDFKGNNPRFVYYLLQTVQLKRFAGGSTVPSLDRNTLSDISLRIPEIAVQQEIVEMLDSVIPSLDFVYPILDKLEARIASARRSLLHAAFSGALTEQWRTTQNG